MSRGRTRRAWGWAFGLALALCLSITASAAGPSLLEAVTANGDVLARLTVAPGGTWCIVWNHSVQGFEVRDCYANRGGRMVLVRSHQPDYAAGLGPVLGRGEPRSDGHGGYWIEHIDEPVPGNRYLLRVGSPRVNHRIDNGERVISLSAIAAGERVVIRLRPIGSGSE